MEKIILAKKSNKKALIGFTGFVGSNLLKQEHFDALFNSTNIRDIAKEDFDIVVSAAPSATKWLANKDPKTDLALTHEFIERLQAIKTHHFVLISTVDVYPSPVNVNEDSGLSADEMQPYGRHRFYIEEAVKELFDNHLIVRLPGLFGAGLKKNFLFDLMHREPRFIGQDKWNSLLESMTGDKKTVLENVYTLLDNGMYGIREEIASETLRKAGRILAERGLTSLVFTHHKSVFQFYDLKQLWPHILLALNHGLSLVNFATEPVSAKEVALQCFGLDFDNETRSPPVSYDMKSKYAELFGGKQGYFADRDTVLSQLHEFFLEEGR